jgi:hypothetical protein
VLLLICNASIAEFQFRSFPRKCILIESYTRREVFWIWLIHWIHKVALKLYCHCSLSSLLPVRGHTKRNQSNYETNVPFVSAYFNLNRWQFLMKVLLLYSLKFNCGSGARSCVAASTHPSSYATPAHQRSTNRPSKRAIRNRTQSIDCAATLHGQPYRTDHDNATATPLSTTIVIGGRCTSARDRCTWTWCYR